MIKPWYITARLMIAIRILRMKDGIIAIFSIYRQHTSMPPRTTVRIALQTLIHSSSKADLSKNRKNRVCPIFSARDVTQTSRNMTKLYQTIIRRTAFYFKNMYLQMQPVSICRSCSQVEISSQTLSRSTQTHS